MSAKTFVISYVPMLYPPEDMGDLIQDSNHMSDGFKNLISELDDVNNSVSGVIWTADYSPVFVMPNAISVARHLEHWTENEPDKWFSLQWLSNEDKYVLALMPSMEKTIGRYKQSFELITGEKPDDNAEYNVIFKPLHFLSDKTNTFKGIKDKIPSKIRIGFLEANSEEEMMGMVNNSNTTIFWLDGEFVFEEQDDDYMRSILNEEQ